VACELVRDGLRMMVLRWVLRWRRGDLEFERRGRHSVVVVLCS
jgi:hypothetical protein